MCGHRFQATANFCLPALETVAERQTGSFVALRELAGEGPDRTAAVSIPLLLKGDDRIHVPLDARQRVAPRQSVRLECHHLVARGGGDGPQERVTIGEVQVELALGRLCPLADVV